MNRLGKPVPRPASLMTLVAVFAMMTLPLSAQGLGPATPADLVTLIGGFTGPSPTCGPRVNTMCIKTRVNSDGTNTEDWSVPAGQSLIVTGIDWVIGSPGALGTGANDTLIINSINNARTRGSKIYDEAVPAGLQAKAIELSGIAVDSGFYFEAQKSGPWTYAVIYVRGYLVDVRGRRP